MTPDPPTQHTTSNPRRAPVAIAGALAALLLFAAFVAAAGDDAAITVVFTDDGMGFTANSTKDLSNIIVELCDGSLHKHDGLTGHTFVHNETQAIAGVWVKSGNNGIPGNDPPGAGQRFDNPFAPCTPTTSSSTTTTTTDEETSTTASTTQTPSEEVPFFTSAPALVLGLGGALGGTLLMLRRRL